MIKDIFEDAWVEEKNVSDWIDTTLSNTERDFVKEKNLYRDLIEEELNEFLDASLSGTEQEQLKELLDLLWVSIGYFISSEGLKDLVEHKLPYLPFHKNNGYLNAYNGQSSTEYFVDKYCSLPDYIYLKSLIVNYINNKLYLSYTRGWEALVRSNFSKFIPSNIENSEDIIRQSLEAIDKNRYNPYVSTQGDYYLIRDKETNKILKPVTYTEFRY